MVNVGSSLDVIGSPALHDVTSIAALCLASVPCLQFGGARGFLAVLRDSRVIRSLSAAAATALFIICRLSVSRSSAIRLSSDSLLWAILLNSSLSIFLDLASSSSLSFSFSSSASWTNLLLFSADSELIFSF